MFEMDNLTLNNQDNTEIGDVSFDSNTGTENSGLSLGDVSGSSIQESELRSNLDDIFADVQPGNSLSLSRFEDAEKLGNIDVGSVADLSFENLAALLGETGDFFSGGSGRNEIIAGGSNDYIKSRDGGVSTIMTGAGQDLVLVGEDDATGQVLDFDPTQDKIAIADELSVDEIQIGQDGDNALILDGQDNVLLAVNNVDAESINFAQVKNDTAERALRREFPYEQLETARRGAGDAVLEGLGDQGNSKLIGRDGDDRLVVAE